MRAISGEVEELLDGLDEGVRQRAALLTGELLAQVSGRAPRFDGEPVVIVQLRESAVRLEAAGPVAPSVQATADPDAVPVDPFADWGRFIIDRLADRWAVVGAAPRSVWAEIELPA